jgi:hypothetical protein
METVSPPIRRRLSFENMKDEMDSIIEHTLNPCDFDNAGTFIEDACDMFVYIYLEDLQASSKDKDSLYYYAVDVFGKYLVEVYNERCGGKDGLNESVGDLSRKAKILQKICYLRNHGLMVWILPYLTIKHHIKTKMVVVI